jgi:hypothetical protein
LDPETSGYIRKLVGQVRLGSINKEDFQRGLSVLNVKVIPTALDGPRRAVPQL